MVQLTIAYNNSIHINTCKIIVKIQGKTPEDAGGRTSEQHNKRNNIDPRQWDTWPRGDFIIKHELIKS